MLLQGLCGEWQCGRWYFSQLDSQGTGLISDAEWRDAMDAVLELDIPWQKYQSFLVLVEQGQVTRLCCAARRYLLITG